MNLDSYSIAVLIPCHNEERTVSDVITSFRAVLPGAHIYVYDNASTDRTFEVARQAGAIVRREPLKGKGHVIRRMFADIESDMYVMVDGDSTYPASSAPELIEALLEHKLDMVTGARLAQAGAFRGYHGAGNRIFNTIVASLFGHGMHDIFSGYRVFSRRFVKSFPALSRGFEIETELSVHALELHLPFTEVDVPYGARPQGSVSKLHTWSDGFRILLSVLSLFKEAKPFRMFSAIATVLMLLAMVLGYPLAVTFMQTHLVPRIPTAIIVIGLAISAVLAFVSGIILDAVAQLRRESKRLNYLRLQALQ
jgi:glycosyltransferase involved in cell wall biosynthesis